MEAIQESYRIYTTKEYRKKILTSLAVWTLCTKERVLAGALNYCKRHGMDLYKELTSRTRGFAATDGDFLEKFRIKPNASLLAMIYHRTATYTGSDFIKKIANYRKFSRALN